MNLGMKSGLAGLGSGIARGIQLGMDMREARERTQARKVATELDREELGFRREQQAQARNQWNRQNAEQAERAELASTYGLFNTLQKMSEGATIDVTFPLPASVSLMLKGRKPASIKATAQGYEAYDDAGNAIGTLSKDQVSYGMDRTTAMLEMFHNLRVRGDADTYKGISSPVYRGGKRVGMLHGREQVGTGIRQWSGDDVRSVNADQANQLQQYMGRLREIVSEKGRKPFSEAHTKELDKLWANVGGSPNDAYHRGGRGLPSQERGVGISNEHLYDDRMPRGGAAGSPPSPRQYDSAESLARALMAGEVSDEEANRIANEKGW